MSNDAIGSEQDPSDGFGQTGRPDYRRAALYWNDFGFQVIPLLPSEKITALKWDDWLAKLSPASIAAYWKKYPTYEVGWINDKSDVIVFDADTADAVNHLTSIEKDHGVTPQLVIKTKRGAHHYYRIAPGAYARTSTFNTEKFQHRIDVKCARSMVVLPPTPGKEVDFKGVSHASELSLAHQDFIDAIFVHNNRLPPRPPQNQPATQADYLKPEPESVSEQADFTSRTLHELRVLINAFDPDESYDDWSTVGMILHHETDGSEEGFSLFDDWSRKGAKYPGIGELRNKWQSFKHFMGTKRTIATLKWMLAARDVDWRELLAKAEPDFEVIVPDADDRTEACVTANTDVMPVEAEPREQTGSPAEGTAKAADVQGEPEQPLTLVSNTDQVIEPTHPLAAYSLTGRYQELKQGSRGAEPVLGKLALRGQYTFIAAPPGAGKTLLALHLLREAIEKGRLDPRHVFIINADDSENGMLEKLALAEECGMEMLVPGFHGFELKQFPLLLQELVQSGQAAKTIIILDTLKKVAATNDKSKMTVFNRDARAFCTSGGTLIALHHVNKKRDEDGNVVYAGTADLRDDADVAYTMDITLTDVNAQTQTVTLTRIKGRGGVAATASYAYSVAENLPYAALLDSMHEVDPLTLEQRRAEEQLQADEPIIQAITAAIRGGTTQKMAIIQAVAAQSGASLRQVRQILEARTGTVPGESRWNYSKGQRGAMLFHLLEA